MTMITAVLVTAGFFAVFALTHVLAEWSLDAGHSLAGGDMQAVSGFFFLAGLCSLGYVAVRVIIGTIA